MSEKRIRIRLENKAGVKIKGFITKREEKGGSKIVFVDIDGTTTNCPFDLEDFQFVHESLS